MSTKKKSSGRIVFECDLCKFETRNYGKRWVEHLLEESHQKLAREASVSSSAKSSKSKKKYVVFGIRNLQIKDVLTYFTSKQIVSDFVFWTASPDVCLVQFFLSGGAVRSLAKNTKSIEGHEVSVRLRSSFSDVEWRCICPAEANRKKNEETGTRIKEEKKDKADCVILHDRLRQNFQAKECVKDESKPAADPISNERDENMELDTPDSSTSDNRRENSEQESVDVVNRSIPMDQRFCHDLRMTIPRQLYNDAKKLLKRTDEPYNIMKNARNKMHQNWLHMIPKFNSLIWENLFGIQLYRGSNPDRVSHLIIKKRRFMQFGSQFVGVLPSIDKIQNWITDAAGGDEKTTTKDKRMETKSQEAAFLNSLIDGSLSGKRLKKSTEKVAEMLRTNVLLSFEAKILVEVMPKKTMLERPLKVMLQFENIVCSEVVQFNQFRKIISSYNRIWRSCSSSKLLQIVRDNHS